MDASLVVAVYSFKLVKLKLPFPQFSNLHTTSRRLVMRNLFDIWK